MVVTSFRKVESAIHLVDDGLLRIGVLCCTRIDYSNDKTKNIRTHNTVNDVLVMPASHGMKNDACCRSSEHTSIFLI